MQHTQQLFLEALKAALKNEQVEWNNKLEAQEWMDLFRMAEVHQILPMIYEAVYRSPAAGQADGDQAIGAGHRVGLLRQVQAETHQRTIAAAEAEAGPDGGFVGEAGLGEHRVFLQIRQLRFEQFAGQGQQVAVAFLDDAEAGDHAALGRAAGTQAGGPFVEIVEVAGELALEELGSVRAAYGEQGFVVERGEEGGVGHGRSLVNKSGRHHRGRLAPCQRVPSAPCAVILRPFAQEPGVWPTRPN